MKKSVVLMIALIYILSIILVGFLGMKMKVYDQKVYVEEIVCLTEGYQKMENTNYDGYIGRVYQEGLKIELKCQVKPDDASFRDLDYLYDTTQNLYTLTKNADGTATIAFLDDVQTTAMITVRSTDGMNKMLVIRIDVF
jgi:DNA polymerase sigma